MSNAKFYAIAILSLTLSACAGVVGPPPAGRIYRIAPPASAVQGVERASWQLSVAVPQAPQSLDTNRIALLQGPSEMDYYANAAWTDSAPSMVQSLMMEAFEASGRINAVAREEAGLRADYLLQTELRDFEAQYDVPNTPPRVVVRMSVRLVKIPERNVMGSTTITKEAKADLNNLPAITAAFSSATGEALKEAVTWTLGIPAPAEPEAPPPPRRHRRRG